MKRRRESSRVDKKSYKRDCDEGKSLKSSPSPDHDDDSLEHGSQQTVCAMSAPFHVDVSALKAFYADIDIAPSQDRYQGYEIKKEPWKVKVGDTVAVHVGRYRREKKKKSGVSVNYPFTVPSWSAEVITIFKNLKNIEEAMKCKKMSVPIGIDERTYQKDNFILELRWLYTRDLIPGMKIDFHRKSHGIGSNQMSDEGILSLDEIFESDHLEEIGATNLLAPICIHSEPNIKEIDLNQTTPSGLPITHYFCKRLWSIRHKTLAPIGSIDKRRERGMLHSSYMTRDSAIMMAFTKVQINPVLKKDDNFKSQSASWEEIFHETISKLTLGDSSSLKPGTLVGREKEQEQIRNFLCSAIQAVNSNEKVEIQNSNLFALFVAGPPGTGKTASVCSVIDALQRDQAEGKIEEFKFVHLNGLEMRHPFDAYVRLWEAISKNKETCSAPKALANLEMYLGGHKQRLSHVDSRRAIVLVMDEIDYLQTRQETVLYNMFDWPFRGYKEKSMAQLIVIGISNTINLPEKLHVRLQSRLGRQRCMFGSYDVKESVNILKEKLTLQGNDMKTVFHPDAIKFAARKIASESGDIRKIFHLCKVTAESVYRDIQNGKRSLNDNTPYGCVTVADIGKASRDMFNTVFSVAIRNSSCFEALLYVALASLRRQSGKENGVFTFIEVLTKMEGIASSFGSDKYLPAPSYSELLDMLSRLGEARIIFLMTPNGANGFHGCNGISDTNIKLNVEDYEVFNALKDTEHLKLAEKHLDRNLF